MQPHKLPSIFDRLFLSHLIMLACACAVAFWLHLYLVGASRFLLRHNPIILIPSVLLLIGIAGVVTTWSARAIARPLERAADSLRTGGPFPAHKGHEELAILIQAVETFSGRPAPDRTGAATDTVPSAVIETSVVNMRRSIGELAGAVELLGRDTEDPASRELLERMKDHIIRLTYESTRLSGGNASASGAS